MTIRSDQAIERAALDKCEEDKAETTTGIKLELGSNISILQKQDWQQFDIVAFLEKTNFKEDFSPIPLEDNSVEEIFAKNIIQRYSKSDAKLALKDWFTLLENFGSITLVVVDINKAMGKYLQTFEEKYLDLVYGKQINKIEFYLYGYTPSTLKKLMIDVGFINVRESTPSADYFDPQVEFILEANKPKIKE